MMPPGHVATIWGVATLLKENNPKLANLDYRLLAICALLPDFIDKSLAILVFTEAHTSQRIVDSPDWVNYRLCCSCMGGHYPEQT